MEGGDGGMGVIAMATDEMGWTASEARAMVQRREDEGWSEAEAWRSFLVEVAGETVDSADSSGFTSLSASHLSPPQRGGSCPG